MIRRNRAAAIFLVLGLIFLIASIPYSAAINRIMLDREADVKLAEDKNAVLKLTGFQNVSYNMDSKYESFGTITNNTGKTIIITVTVIPDFEIYHFLTRIGVEIGKDSCEFRYSNSSPRQLTLTMVPGQIAEVKAYVANNLFYALPVEFQFTAADTAGTFTIKLINTSSTPRCIYLY